MHRTARIVWGVVPVLCLACALPAWAQKREVTVEYILSTFKPQHADVDIDTPDRKEWAQCKVELLEGKSGYLVLGPAGQVLRRFADTNGDDKTDQWGYYHNGLEVYRELDTNANNKIDQARWFNLGGTRWGVDANEDGKIDEWRQMSAEELSKLVVRALVTADTDLLTPLLVTKDDLKTLGIKGNLETRLMGSVSPIAAQWPKICKSSPVITPKTAWRRFDSSGPGLIPADTHKSKQDLLVTENAMAFVDYGDARQQGLVVLGELLKVGETWKLTGPPTPADPEGKIELPSGLVMFEAIRGAAPVAVAGATPDAVPEKVGKLFNKLRDLQEKPPAANATKSEWQKHYKDLDYVLVELFNEATTDDNREQWVRQLLDVINEGVQSGRYPTGIKRLKELDSEMAVQFPKLAAFAEYRRTWAEYTLAMRATEDDESRTKVHSQWLKDLEAFVEKHPRSDDSAEAALQLGFEYEFAGKVEKARGWSQRVVADYSKTDSAKRADGALLRLGLNGKLLALSGTGLQGGMIDTRQFKGKTLLVLFWDTRSKPAAEDLPALKELYQQYHAQGFEILGVSLDPEKEATVEFVKQRNVAWPQIHEAGGLESEPARKFGIITLPTMFLVDGNGKVMSRNASLDEIREALAGPGAKK